MSLAVEPYDEAGIAGEDTIIRRINPIHHIVWDENRQKHRISPKAYNKSSGPKEGMSVDIERLIVGAGVNPQEYVTTPVFTGSVALRAGDVRALGLWVGYDPIEGVHYVPDNPYHGEVWSPTERKNFTDSQKSALAHLAQWYVPLPNVDLV